jgi:hypothetical protein
MSSSHLAYFFLPAYIIIILVALLGYFFCFTPTVAAVRPGVSECTALVSAAATECTALVPAGSWKIFSEIRA